MHIIFALLNKETKSSEFIFFYANDVLFTFRLVEVLVYCFFFSLHLNYDQLCFRELLVHKNGKLHTEGKQIKNKKYAKTLEIIQQDPESFYNGNLAENILRDMSTINSNISRRDLRNYKIEIREPLKGNLSNMSMYLSPPPSSGAVLALILNILKG